MNNSRESSKDKLRKKKFLRNKKSFIILTVLCMGIGFAFLSTNLTITGNTSVSGNSWNIYFTNVQVAEDSVDATVVPTTTGTNTTSIDYTVTLDKPGDFYEFTVDAVNNGTINAMIQNVNMTTLDSDVAKYISYTATYEDGTPLAQNDVLKKNTTATYKVRVEYKKNISASDLSEEDNSLTLTFGVNYVQAPKPVESKFIKLVKNSALSDSSINFGAISSASNGRGLYVMHDTIEDTYPIYYYRGKVSNNNAKFAGYCWKIVRTTETGGTKLVYNGIPNSSGQCINTTGNATQLSSNGKFNNYTSPAFAGYMYGEVYERKSQTKSTSHLYGNTFVYEDGNYRLVNTHGGVDSTHHYTCFNSTGVCTSISYVYYVSGSNVYYIALENGKSIQDAFTEMQTNSNDSLVKQTIDTWFNDNFKTFFVNSKKSYNYYLEDTIWCNDRSVNTTEVTGVEFGNSAVNDGFKPNGGNTSNFLWYSPYARVKNGKPSLVCSNKNDSFTVNETITGNGDLTYPVGLLTSDEAMLAGGQLYAVANNNTDFYLNTNLTWWTMSPTTFSDIDVYWGMSVYNVYGIGTISDAYVNGNYGFRPSISLKPTVKIATGGDGSPETPYEFLVD